MSNILFIATLSPQSHDKQKIAKFKRRKFSLLISCNPVAWDFVAIQSTIQSPNNVGQPFEVDWMRWCICQLKWLLLNVLRLTNSSKLISFNFKRYYCFFSRIKSLYLAQHRAVAAYVKF